MKLSGPESKRENTDAPREAGVPLRLWAGDPWGLRGGCPSGSGAGAWALRLTCCQLSGSWQVYGLKPLPS